MAKVLPLNIGQGDRCPPLPRGLVIGLRRPQTAPSTTTYLSSKQHSPGGVGESRLTPLISNRVKSPPDEALSLDEVEMLVHQRLKECPGNIRTAFRTLDPHGRGSVSRAEFSHVLEALLSLSRSQINTLTNKVCRNGVTDTVDYMEFLRTHGPSPTAHRARSQMRQGPDNSSSMPLCEIQKHLKEQIGANLKTMVRVFRLFDRSRQGAGVQRHEFRRILDNYCLPLTDREFERVWHYYSPNNMANISYKLFLEKLGFGQTKNTHFAPDCTKLELASHRVTPPQRDQQGHVIKGRRPASSGSRGDPSPVQGLTPIELHNLFHEKMREVWTPLWQTLQALDATRSGLVERPALRAALGSFLFPMSPHLFHLLTSRYGVRATGQVKWKHFMSHFVSRGEEDSHSATHSNRTSGAHPGDHHLDLQQQIYSWLNEIFHLLDKRGDGWITRAAVRRALEVPQSYHLTRRRRRRASTVTTTAAKQPATAQTRLDRPRLAPAQITELLRLLDPSHTGVVHRAALEKLHPPSRGATNPAGDRGAPPPSSPRSSPGSMERPEGTPTQRSAEEQEEEKQTPRWADRRPVAASVSWRVAENLLKDNLSDQRSSVRDALTLCDPGQTGYIDQEDLRTLVLRYGTAISQPHFNKLCESCSSSSNSLVRYNEFLRNLGVTPQDDTLPPPPCYSEGDSTERQNTPPQPQTTVDCEPGPGGVQQPVPPSLPHSVLDIVFKRMRDRLDQRHASLTDRIHATTTHGPRDALSEGDLRKILEDSWVVLDDRHFRMLTEVLGFRNGRMDVAEFLAKYEELSSRDRERDAEGYWGTAGDKVRFLTAEQCLAALKTRIKNIHGDNMAAFRLMDRNNDGVVDAQDFRELWDSLELSARRTEYQRLLALMGLQIGGTLNYQEFFSLVQNNGKARVQPPANVPDELHDQLASKARLGWPSMSKALCRFDANGRGLVLKKGLRSLLFSHNLPMRPHEFDQLWSRYDPDGRGCVTTAAFLDRLGVEHEEGDEGGPAAAQDVSPVMDEQNADTAQLSDTQASSDATALQHIERIIQNNYGELSDALARLDQRKDGTVRVSDLLGLLCGYGGSSVQNQDQLVRILNRLKVSMDDSCRKMAYMDFLSAFVHKEEEETCERRPDLCLLETLEGRGLTQALARMKELVAASSTTLHKAFSTFDQSETGLVSALAFRRVLENMCGRQTDEQYRHMLTKLDLNWGHHQNHHAVNWRDFLNKCTPSSPTLEHVCSRTPVNTTGRPEHREFLKRSGAEDDETTHSEPPSPTDDNVPNIPSSPEPTEITSAAMLSRRPKTAGAVLQRSESKSAPQCSFRASSAVAIGGWRNPPLRGCRSPRSGGWRSPLSGSMERTLRGSMERTLRGDIQRSWKDIQRRCTEVDPHQDGHIDTISFLDILKSLDISVTEEELERLSVKYDDIGGNGRVSYPHFLLTLRQPEVTEVTQVFQRCKLPLPTTKMTGGVLSGRCAEVLLRLTEPVQRSWRRMRRSFLASDPSRTGNVSMQDLRKVLRHFSVSLSEEDFFHISSYFDANASGKISYDHFLRAFLR